MGGSIETGMTKLKGAALDMPSLFTVDIKTVGLGLKTLYHLEISLFIRIPPHAKIIPSLTGGLMLLAAKEVGLPTLL